MVILDAASPAGENLREAVGRALDAYLDDAGATLLGISPRLEPLLRRARLFARGGKRLRPAFCVWGYLAAGGDGASDSLVRAASSLDLLHVSALVHDDVMDASDTRRGVPAAHRQFEADHREAGLRGSAGDFGRAGAILLGDLLLVWSGEMFRGSGLGVEAILRAQPFLQAVRTEVTAGQYLDVLAQARDPYALSRTPAGRADLVAMAHEVVTYKSACYTVQRPLDIGGALAGATAAQHRVFTGYGRPLGRAFQYRDDLLGVFGDASLTGKESGEDLREGKLTLLVADAFGRASPAAAQRLAGLFGRSDLDSAGVDAAREILVDCGASAVVERAIESEYAAALAALDGAPLTADGVTGLRNLARAAVERRF